MEVHWINVGEGDCVLILFPNGKSMVVDIDTWQPLGGGELEDALGYLRQHLPKKNGVPRIDLLVCTHPHRDHASGIAAAIDEFDVGEVWESGHRLTGDAAEEDWYKELIQALQAAGAKAPKASGEARNPFADETKVWVLSPARSISAGTGDAGRKDIHDECMVLKIEDADGNSVLLGADSRVNGWRDAIVPTFGPNGSDLSGADIFQGPHHGSRSFFKTDKDDEPYLDGLSAISPDTVVISVGPNTHEHPHRDALEQYEKDGRQVVRTDKEGTIVAISAKSGWEFKSDRGAHKAGNLAVSVGGHVVLPDRNNPRTKPHSNYGCGH